MADSPRKLGSGGTASDLGAIRSAGRRRLLQAAISTAPVVMTVLSRPVLAQVGVCQSPSGFVSGNASSPGMNIGCTGNGPDYYSANPSSWPDGFVPETSTVNNLFEIPETDPPSPLLQTVLEEGTTSVKAQIVAADFNIRNDDIPPTVLTLNQTRHMWNEFSSTNGYTPSSGASWTATELLDYLQRLNSGTG